MQRDPGAPKVALNLTGGGARAAYQVGVLQAICELVPQNSENPFPIVCGTSAGAVNAAVLAAHAMDFGAGVRRLVHVWENLYSDQVYRSDSKSVRATGARWLKALMPGGVRTQRPVSLLDNAPLAELLGRTIPFQQIGECIACGVLDAVGITASGYTSGLPVTFFEGAPMIEPWVRARRLGVSTRIGVAHLMASSAIPFIFPAVQIGQEFFGDGAMRQVAPMTPALHLGAHRILVISAGRLARVTPRQGDGHPSIAQIAGHAINSIFLDNVEADLERVELINKIVGLVPDEKLVQSGIGLRRVEVVLISPSGDIEGIAVRHADDLPRSVRVLFGGAERMRRSGAILLSYLLFQKAYCRELIALGYQDAMAHKGDLISILGS
jgi:NTE family protein